MEPETLHLRAGDEETLAGALPQLRGAAMDGSPCWLVSGPHHVFDAIGVLVLTPPAVDPVTGDVTAPAVLDTRWHANLRVDGAHPDHDAILVACGPYTVVPTEPRRVFA